MLAAFASTEREPRRCSFFAEVPGSGEAGCFDFDAFFELGLPVLWRVALEMPALFDPDAPLPIFRTYSAAALAAAPGELGRGSVTLSRPQCACLLAHSFLGSLRRPEAVLPNDWRFTVSDLFVGASRSPNSGAVFLNYWTVLGRAGFADGEVTFERRGFQRSRAGAGAPPWRLDACELPLCPVRMGDGNLEESAADVHAEFANAFVGGGVMTGDFAMEEILFLVKPELLVAMALQNRMCDGEAVCVHGARQYVQPLSRADVHTWACQRPFLTFAVQTSRSRATAW